MEKLTETKQKRCISYTQVVSELSNVAKVMEMLNLNEVVQIYVPKGNKVQWDGLNEKIRQEELCRVELGHGNRLFIYCRVNAMLTDEGNIAYYEEMLAEVFGMHQDGSERPRFTYHARVYRCVLGTGNRRPLPKPLSTQRGDVLNKK